MIELNRARFARRGDPVFSYVALCRELAGTDLGELSSDGARSVLRRYSAACLESAKRKKAGLAARYPRRRRALFPVRFYRGFEVDGRRLRLPVAKRSAPLWLRLTRDLPYDPAAVRSVTLLADTGGLFVDVTAELPVEDHELDPSRVAGVDLGIVHPYAVAGPDRAGLLVSGRQLRAEERLHLEDTKRRHPGRG